MLEQLMNEICAGGTLETGVLATRLGTSPRLIEAMLEHLQRAGLIQPYVSCADGCQGCSLRDGCRRQDAIHLWQSTTEE